MLIFISQENQEIMSSVCVFRSVQELAHIEFKPEIGTWPWAPVVQKNISVPEVRQFFLTLYLNNFSFGMGNPKKIYCLGHMAPGLEQRRFHGHTRAYQACKN